MKVLVPILIGLMVVGCAITVEFPHGAQDKQTRPFVNTLGMKFVSVPGTDVQFCIWETRVKDYAAYATMNEGVSMEWKTPEFVQLDTHPVVRVRWEDAQAFCTWLTKKEQTEGKLKAGQLYRLPTDAEWSVAVGLGKETGNTPKEKHKRIEDVYPWGKEWPPPIRAGNYGQSLKVDSFVYTSPVGSFEANENGLYDLGGNVWEWCEEKWTPTDNFHVYRGASWGRYHQVFLLSSDRNVNSPGRVDRDCVGFRCVLTNGSGR